MITPLVSLTEKDLNRDGLPYRNLAELQKSWAAFKKAKKAKKS
jgi:hypothetical protein